MPGSILGKADLMHFKRDCLTSDEEVLFAGADSVVFIAIWWWTAVLPAKYSLGSCIRMKASSRTSCHSVGVSFRKNLKYQLNQHHVACLIHGDSQSQLVVKSISEGIEGLRMIIGVG